MKAWDDEKQDYTYATQACSAVCGHYTQVGHAQRITMTIKKIYNIHVYSQCAGLIKSIVTVHSIIVIDVYT